MKQLENFNFYFKITGKEILFLILLWLLIYLEPITLGPLKISQIWKAGVVAVMLFYIIGKKIPSFIWIGILFSLKFLFYTYLPYGILRAVQDSLETLIFPLFLAVFYIKYRNRPDATESLIHIAILLSFFIIFSALPFFFGLKSLNPITELDKYGLETNATKGLFYHVAVSSKLFTVATIVLINSYSRFSKSSITKFFWLVTVLMGSYFVYTSWTRTGWLIFLIALLFSLFYAGSVKKKFIAISVSVLIGFGLVLLYEGNEAFQMRLTGGATYRTDTELSVDQIVKARMPFIMVALDNLNEEGLDGQLIGYGTQRGIDLFDKKTGMAIVSHNGTFEILESSGIIGFFLFLIFLFRLFKNVFKYLKYVQAEIKKLALVSVLMFFGFFLTSHGASFFGEIIFSCFFIAVILEGRNFKGKYNYLN